MFENGFYKTWKAYVHTIPRLQALMQGGIGESYPTFAYTDSGLHIRHFYFPNDQTGPNMIVIGTPQILVTLDYETGEILNTDDDPFNLPPFDLIEYTLSADVREARRPDVKRLQALYDQMLATYPEPPDRAILDDFVATLEWVVPPVLWPYYEQLQGDMASTSQ
jgi:hypothetical protein